MKFESFVTTTCAVSFFILLVQEDALGVPLERETNADVIDCPRIVTREEWHARKRRGQQPLRLTPTPYVVVHHGGIRDYCQDQEKCSAIVRSYQNLHMDVREWFDIGYNFVIGEDGNVYEGRGWNLVGAHAPNYNSQSIGICIIGDFTDFLPNKAALKALNSLIACGVSLGKIGKEYSLLGHRQARVTECPGETFYKYVMQMPRWTPHPVPYPISTVLLESTTENSKETENNTKDNIR